MNGFIYKITNKVNGKVYIGQTRHTVEARFKQHIKNCTIEKRNQPLYLAMSKYGIDKFDVETLEEVNIENLDEREIYWIAKYDSFNNGYNATIGGQGGKTIYWTDEKYEEIKNMYLSGFTSKYIAEKFNVSAWTITQILKSLRVKIKGNPLDMNNYELKQFIELYENGVSLKELAKRYNTDAQTVKRFLLKHNVNIRIHSELINNTELHQELINDYINKYSFKQLEEKFHSDTRTIKRILVINGIDLTKHRGVKSGCKGSFCLSPEQCLEAIEMYNNMVPVKKISEKFEINVTTLYNLLKHYHIDCNRYNSSKSVQTPIKG